MPHPKDCCVCTMPRINLKRLLVDDKAAFDFIRCSTKSPWPIICSCGSQDLRLIKNPSLRFRCRSCRRSVSLWKGSLFSGLRIPPTHWLAILNDLSAPPFVIRSTTACKGTAARARLIVGTALGREEEKFCGDARKTLALYMRMLYSMKTGAVWEFIRDYRDSTRMEFVHEGNGSERRLPRFILRGAEVIKPQAGSRRIANVVITAVEDQIHAVCVRPDHRSLEGLAAPDDGWLKSCPDPVPIQMLWDSFARLKGISPWAFPVYCFLVNVDRDARKSSTSPLRHLVRICATK